MKKSLLLLGMSLSSAFSQAATVSSQFGLPVSQTVADINQTGSLALFDSTLGMLTGARLELDGAVTFAFGVTNTSAQSQNINVTDSTRLFFTSGLGALNSVISAGAQDILLSTTTGARPYQSWLAP